MNFTFLIFLGTFISLRVCIKVFNFKKTQNTNLTNFASTTLENIPLESLPRKFTVCTSHQQGRIDKNTKTVFVIYEDVNRKIPWLSVGFWENGLLWANLEDTYWYLLDQMPVNEIFGWVHICTQLDLDREVIRTSVNGRESKVVEEVRTSSSPPRLYMMLGVVEHSWYQGQAQYHGKVTNIRIYRDIGEVNMENMTSSPCASFNLQTFMLWEQMQWSLTEAVEVITVRDEKFCTASNKYNVMLPSSVTYEAAKDACFKLREGSITEPAVLELDSSILLTTCPYTWTPYTDTELENRFINEHTGEVVE